MSDLISKRDVLVRLHKLLDKLGDPGARALGLMAQMQLEGMGTVDAVPVVRCKDCRYRGSSYGCPLRTLVHTEGRGYHYADMTTDTGYCSYGARKEAGE